METLLHKKVARGAEGWEEGRAKSEGRRAQKRAAFRWPENAISNGSRGTAEGYFRGGEALEGRKATEGYVPAEISIQFLPQERKHASGSRSENGSRF